MMLLIKYLMLTIHQKLEMDCFTFNSILDNIVSKTFVLIILASLNSINHAYYVYLNFYILIEIVYFAS